MTHPCITSATGTCVFYDILKHATTTSPFFKLRYYNGRVTYQDKDVELVVIMSKKGDDVGDPTGYLEFYADAELMQVASVEGTINAAQLVRSTHAEDAQVRVRPGQKWRLDFNVPTVRGEVEWDFRPPGSAASLPLRVRVKRLA